MELDFMLQLKHTRLQEATLAKRLQTKTAVLSLASVILCFSFFGSVDRVFAETKAPHASLAPADKTFGRLKMTILTIRNMLKDLRENLRHKTPESVLGQAVFVEDAIRDLARQYPKDSDFPKDMSSLTLLYQNIPLDDARVRGVEADKWLRSYYPQSVANVQASI